MYWLNGKRTSRYYSLKDDIDSAGTIYTNEPCVVDGKIVSTVHYKDMSRWMKGVLDGATYECVGQLTDKLEAILDMASLLDISFGLATELV